ncbi:MAG: esterase family protein [Bacteroidales bacterium]|nr:esterase family protein [Bacteroidales bacterium]
MVIVNGYNILEGCFYQNSPVTGNWEDFVVNDVVKFIDAKYRTIPKAGSRALIGLSMGGYGALTLSMRHPSVFSVGVGECPGLADPQGMMKTSLFNDQQVINRIISIRNELQEYSKEEAHQKISRYS